MEKNRTFKEKNRTFKKNQKVSLLIASRTEMGYIALIDGAQEGILYKNEVFQPLKVGQKINGYVKKVRDDGKIDLYLQKPGYKAVDALSASIMYRLRHQKGFIAVTDDSRPEDIADMFGVSKKVFKKAVGNLYKQRLIVLDEDGIRLKEGSERPTPASQKGRRGKGPSKSPRSGSPLRRGAKVSGMKKQKSRT